VVKSTYLPTISLPSSKEPGNPTSMDSSHPHPFVEGWKALMSVVSRSYRRKTAGSKNPFGGLSGSISNTLRDENDNDISFEAVSNESDVDQVSEIVKDVKSRHGGVRIAISPLCVCLSPFSCLYPFVRQGRDLLRFVKGLLG